MEDWLQAAGRTEGRPVPSGDPWPEVSGEPREATAEFSSFTTSGSKPSTVTTFNSSVFVPSISSELYGQVGSNSRVTACINFNIYR